ncbi:nmrA-like family protein [Flagelloscypha sp. PMI_526]|nr:nmrA-like family protein [Flagelloscypha sp. PMI_526]
MTTTIGIAGITGKFARCLVRSLLSRQDVSIRGYCRDANKAADLASFDQVQIIQGDALDPISVQAFVAGCDVVVCCYLGDNTLMVDGQKLLIDACDKCGVARYVASDWAFDYRKLEFGQVFAKDPMKHILAYLESPEHTVKGVHILVVWEGTTYQNAAEYTAAVCLDPDAIGIQRFLGGRSTTFEISESFEKVYGVKPKLNNLGSLEDLFNLIKKRQTDEPQNIFGYLFLCFQYYALNGQTLLGLELDNQNYPAIEAVDWEGYMRNIPVEGLGGQFQALAA